MSNVKRTRNPEFEKAIKEMAAKKEVAKVGFLGGKDYENGESVAGVAAEQEYGNPAKRIPSRSFMRTTQAEKKDEWKIAMQDFAKDIVNGKMTIHDALEGIGAVAAGDMREKISTITEPKLSERTLAERKERGNSSTKPLVDTALMFSTLTHAVEAE
jgi:predicted amidohydrolase YtcJ